MSSSSGDDCAGINELPEFLKPKLRLFLSADVVGSTQFKQRGPLSIEKDGWLGTFIQFYRDIERDFFAQWDAYKSFAEKNHWPARGNPEFWKCNGDEVIFTKILNDHREAFAGTYAWVQAVRKYREELHSKHKGLDLKATAWLAGFPINNSEIAFRTSAAQSSAEIAEATTANYDLLEKFYSGDLRHGVIRDFIGPSIDLGFRLSQHSTPQKMVVSVDLALMVSYTKPKFGHFRELKYGYDGRQVMRGAMGGSPYPIFWIDMLEDDELTTAENSISPPQRPNSDNICKLCEQYIKNHPEYMIRPFIWNDSDGDFGTVPNGHQEQLRQLCQNWRSAKANETIAEQAVRGGEPPGEPAATGEVTNEALNKLVSGISSPFSKM
jgi:hypothetical protein